MEWLCWTYRFLLYAYPKEFRRRYGGEMEQVFKDRCREAARNAGWPGVLQVAGHALADWAVTTVRERVDDRPAPATASLAVRAADGVPTFYIGGADAPRTGFLIHGGVLAVGVFSLISFLIAHGGIPGLVLVRPLAENPRHKDASLRLNPIFDALDLDGDGVLSGAEIDSAPAVLRTLDANHDGKLSAEECGGDVRANPILAAIDTDHDGVISASEIHNSAAALRALFDAQPPR